MAKGRVQPLNAISLPDVGLSQQCSSTLMAHRRQGHPLKCSLSGAHCSPPQEMPKSACHQDPVSPTVM